MLDYRAWIAAAVLLLAASGAYLVYVHRTRAGYTARSLTAPGHPPANSPQGNTRTLHVEGCAKDFVVRVGELVEPRAVPGAPLAEFQSLYGKPSRRGKPGVSTWDLYPFSLAEGSVANSGQPPFVLLSVNQGHVVQTLDDIELGIDSFGTIFRKLRDQKIEAHERISHTDGPNGGAWTLTVTFASACGRGFRSEYSRTLEATPELDRQIDPAPAVSSQSSQSSSQPQPYHSDAFMNKVVSEYTMVSATGSDDPSAGSPSQHE